MISLTRMVRRTKTKYFQGGRLLWDEHSSAGKYVRENCKASCDLCGPVDPDCQDNNIFCFAWARAPGDFCNTNDYVKTNCKKFKNLSSIKLHMFLF